MKMRHLTVLVLIAAGFIAGLAVRQWLRSHPVFPAPSVTVATTTAPAVKVESPAAGGAPLFTVDQTPLTALSDADWAALQNDCRHFDPANPLRAEAMAMLRLLAGLQTEEDFQRAIPLLRSLPWSGEMWQEDAYFIVPLLRVIARRWSKIDPDHAVAGLMDVLGDDEVHDVVSNFDDDLLASLLPGADLEGQIKSLLESRSGLLREQGPDKLLIRLSETQPIEALAFLAAHRDLLPESQPHFSNFSDPEKRATVLDWIATQCPETQRAWFAERTLHGWGDFSLKAADAWLATLSLAPGENERLRAILYTGQPLEKELWPDGLAAVQAASGTENRDQMLRRFAAGSTQDPSGFHDFVSALPPGPDRDTLAAASLDTLTQHRYGREPFNSFAPIQKWLDLLSAPAREAALRDIPHRLTVPVLQEWLDTQPPGPERELAARAQRWKLVMDDPAAALAGALAIPDRGDRLHELRERIQHWQERDMTAASGWASRLPPGPERDALADRLAATVRTQEPESAMAWAASIADPTQRSDSLHNSFLPWHDDDPPTALRWLDTTTLLDSAARADLRAAILEKSGGGP